MSVLEWKKINLLELVPCALFDKLSGINAITGCCYNENNMIFCDADNNVHVFTRNFDKITFQPGNVPVKNCSLTNDGFLLTLIQDQRNFSILLQIYNVQKLVKQQETARISVARLNAFSLATTMVAAKVEDVFVIIIGFEKGDILSHRAIISRDISSNFRNTIIGIRSIVGIQLDLRPKLSNSINVFVSTSDSVFYVTIGETDDVKCALETSKNADRHAHYCTMHYFNDSEDAYFVVCRDDAIYCFTSDGRGPCYALEGRKNFISWVGNNLVVVVQPKLSSVTMQPSNLIAIDVHNKLIVFCQPITEEIDWIFSQNHKYILFTKKPKKILVLQERDLQTKLRILVNKHMYDTALQIIKSSNESMSVMSAQINMKYGNYLLQKGDIKGAVFKYIETIGFVKPSHIIQKLLDSRYNNFLLQYINALITNDCFHDELRNLLQSCYHRCELPAQIKTEYFKNKLLPMSWEMLKAANTNELLCQNDICDNLKKIGLEKYPEDTLEIIQVLINRKVIKNPERLISLFFSEAEMGINFLNNLIRHRTNCNHKVYNNLLVYYLSLWFQAKLKTNDILEFLQNNKEQIQAEHALTICKVYSFFPGIKQVLSSYREHTSGSRIQNLLKDPLNNPLTPSNIIIVLNSILKKNPNCLLQNLKNISSNKLLQVNSVKEFFLEENLQQIERDVPIYALREELIAMKMLMKRYKENPIEYRNGFCDVCRTELKLPSIFFLCQHSFHKECINSYNSHGTCTTCVTFKARKLETTPSDITGDEAIRGISILLAEGLFFSPVEKTAFSINEDNSVLKTYWKGRFVPNRSINTIGFQQKNPFEDGNTNPFE